MIANLQPYPEYKESGLPWLGGIPRQWDTGPGFAAFREKQVKNTGMREKTVLSLSYGRIVVKPPEKLHGLVPESFETYQIVDPGDIIIRSTDLQNDWNSLRVGLVRNRGIITSAYLCFRTTSALSPEYGYQLLHSFDLMKVFYGMGSGLRQNLDFRDFKRMLIFVPPPEEQAVMVRFLDYANGRLERAIRAKRKVIALLNEQKQAIIHRAVTRGLDPNVPLKPSGIPWLGDIPKHWEVRRLRFCIRGKLTYGANAAAEFDNPDWPRYLRITDFKADGSLRPDTFRCLPPEIAKDYLVEDGDILFARSGATVGKAFLVRTDTVEACYAGYLIRARSNTDVVLPSFLFAFTRSTAFIRWKDSIFNRATIQNIGADKYANLPVPIPPIVEQQAILDSIETELAPIRTASSRIEREMELLREYRTRLVADVVTGKLDVREVARQLPEEAAEMEAAPDTEELSEPEPEEVEA